MLERGPVFAGLSSRLVLTLILANGALALSELAIVSSRPSRLKTMVDRQVPGAIAQFEKASTVAKLKAARDRKRARDGKCEGRKSHVEMNPELVALAKRLRRRGNPKTGERKSLRSIAAQLAQLGYVNVNGHPFAAESIQAMIRRR
jgi:hypothetical protein